jgi:hypothetical protein
MEPIAPSSGNTPIHGECSNMIVTSSNLGTMPPVGTIGSSSNGSTSTSTGANALEDALYDQYQQLNRLVFEMEQRLQVLNENVVQLSYQDVTQATRLNLQLKEQNNSFVQTCLQRNHTLARYIIHCPNLLKQVQLLKKSLLNDIKQVQKTCHSQLLQIDKQLIEQKKMISQLKAGMEQVLTNPMQQQMLHVALNQLNEGLNIHENKLKALQEQKEQEIIRLVQYTKDFREILQQEAKAYKIIRNQIT